MLSAGKIIMCRHLYCEVLGCLHVRALLLLLCCNAMLLRAWAPYGVKLGGGMYTHLPKSDVPFASMAFVGAGMSIEHVAAACTENSQCRAFNSKGELK